MSKTIILAFCLLLISLPSVVISDDMDDLEQIINEMIEIDGMAFYNYCYYKDSPRDNDELFLLVITSRGGELFSIRDELLFRESVINYMPNDRDLYYDSYGGLWNINYLTEVIDYLLQGNFKILSEDKLSIRDKVNESILCEINHKYGKEK